MKITSKLLRAATSKGTSKGAIEVLDEPVGLKLEGSTTCTDAAAGTGLGVTATGVWGFAAARVKLSAPGRSFHSSSTVSENRV